jgi:hypothetical protein
MHARVTRLDDPKERVDEAVKYIKEQIVPNAKKQPGFQHGYWMVDRATGKAMAVVIFDSEASVKATDEVAARTRAGAEQASGGKVTSVDRYEVVAEA